MTEQDYIVEKLAGKHLIRKEIIAVKECRDYPNGLKIEYRVETFKEWKLRKEQK